MAARKERRQRQELSLLPLSYLNQALLRAAFFDSLEALSAFSAVVGLGPQRWKLVSFKIGLCTSTVFPSTSLLKVLMANRPVRRTSRPLVMVCITRSPRPFQQSTSNQRVFSSSFLLLYSVTPRLNFTTLLPVSAKLTARGSCPTLPIMVN